jgi:hypothetical protein
MALDNAIFNVAVSGDIGGRKRKLRLTVTSEAVRVKQTWVNPAYRPKHPLPIG